MANKGTIHVRRRRMVIKVGVLLTLPAFSSLIAQEPSRAHGMGFSVPIPTGFRSDTTSREFVRDLYANGGLALVRREPTYVDIMIVPAASDPRHEPTLDHCASDAAAFAEEHDLTVQDVRIAQSPFGPTCEMAVVSRSDNHAALITAVAVEGPVWGVTCNYDVSVPDVAEILQMCREVVAGWETEWPWEIQEALPRYVPVPERAGVSMFTDSLVDELPALVSAPPLEYPDLMKRAGIEGSVVLAAVIGQDGRTEPGSIQVVNSSHPAFEWPAAELLAGATFRPGRVKGEAVRVLIEIPIRFTLQDPPSP